MTGLFNSGSRNEDTVKSYFRMLLNDYAHKNKYEVVREVFCMGTKGTKVKPDGSSLPGIVSL